MRTIIGIVALAALAVGASAAVGAPSALRAEPVQVTGLRVVKGDLSSAPRDRGRVQFVLSLRDRLDHGPHDWASLCVELRDPADGGLIVRHRAIRSAPKVRGGRSRVRLVAPRAATRRLQVGDRVRASVRYRVAATRPSEVRCPGATGKRAHMGSGPGVVAYADAFATLEDEAMVDGGLVPDATYTQNGINGWQMSSTPQGSLYGSLLVSWPDEILAFWGTEPDTSIPIGVPVQIIEDGEATTVPPWGGSAGGTSTLTANLVPGTKNVAVSVGEAGWCVLLSPDGDGLTPGQACP